MVSIYFLHGTIFPKCSSFQLFIEITKHYGTIVPHKNFKSSLAYKIKRLNAKTIIEIYCKKIFPEKQNDF